MTTNIRNTANFVGLGLALKHARTTLEKFPRKKIVLWVDKYEENSDGSIKPGTEEISIGEITGIDTDDNITAKPSITPAKLFALFVDFNLNYSRYVGKLQELGLSIQQ
jgi:hypothetical protein